MRFVHGTYPVPLISFRGKTYSPRTVHLSASLWTPPDRLVPLKGGKIKSIALFSLAPDWFLEIATEWAQGRPRVRLDKGGIGCSRGLGLSACLPLTQVEGQSKPMYLERNDGG